MKIELTTPNIKPVAISLPELQRHVIYQNIRTKRLVIRCSSTQYVLIGDCLFATNSLSTTFLPSEITSCDWIVYDGSIVLSNGIQQAGV